jgi:hypothetical protein
MDLSVIEDYARLMMDGVKFPPLIVFKVHDEFILVDGYHRFIAARYADLKEFLCDIREGSRRDAILYSCGANSSHGLRRTHEDKYKAVAHLLNDPEWGKWSSREIASKCNVSHTFVGNAASENVPNAHGKRKYTTKHGKTGHMATGKIGKTYRSKKIVPITPTTPIQPGTIQWEPNWKQRTYIDRMIEYGYYSCPGEVLSMGINRLIMVSAAIDRAAALAGDS